MSHDTSNTWRIGDLAQAAGVSTDTIRHYERKGVLHALRSTNGYRHYPTNSLERLRMIRQALAVGFTLDELAAIFKIFERGGAPCRQVRELAANKLSEIEQHLIEVTALRDELKSALKDWDARLARTTSGDRAGLLQSLANRNSVRGSSTRLLLRKPKRSKKGKKQ